MHIYAYSGSLRIYVWYVWIDYGLDTILSSLFICGSSLVLVYINHSYWYYPLVQICHQRPGYTSPGLPIVSVC